MTEQSVIRAKKDLHAIISNYAMQAYLAMNKKKDGTFYKKRRQYTLPYEAEEARKLLYLLDKNNITLEEEENIKAFLIPYRTIRTEYLINTDERMR